MHDNQTASKEQTSSCKVNSVKCKATSVPWAAFHKLFHAETIIFRGLMCVKNFLSHKASERAFSIAGPRAWSSLHAKILEKPWFLVFSRSLEEYLIIDAYSTN